MSGTLIAILGAESTGKTQLAETLTRRLQGQGHDAVWVPEYLRTFCDAHQRTPTQAEQSHIAAEQTRRITQALQAHELVLADTTALMTAIYSDTVFADLSLYEQAKRDHAQATVTLLTGLDLPWVADGLQRDGPHVREGVDALLRSALQSMGSPYAVVMGQGEARVAQALTLIEHLLDEPARKERAARSPKWRWVCEKCDDADCEQHSWLPRALKASAS